MVRRCRLRGAAVPRWLRDRERRLSGDRHTVSVDLWVWPRGRRRGRAGAEAEGARPRQRQAPRRARGVRGPRCGAGLRVELEGA